MHASCSRSSRWILGVLALGLLLTSIPSLAAAQVPEQLAPSDTLWEVTLTDGSTIFWGERLSADARLAAFVGEDSGCCLPMVNFVYSFGRQR